MHIRLRDELEVLRIVEAEDDVVAAVTVDAEVFAVNTYRYLVTAESGELIGCEVGGLELQILGSCLSLSSRLFCSQIDIGQIEADAER